MKEEEEGGESSSSLREAESLKSVESELEHEADQKAPALESKHQIQVTELGRKSQTKPQSRSNSQKSARSLSLKSVVEESTSPRKSSKRNLAKLSKSQLRPSNLSYCTYVSNNPLSSKPLSNRSRTAFSFYRSVYCSGSRASVTVYLLNNNNRSWWCSEYMRVHIFRASPT